jgi:shikimate kinase
MIGSNKRFTASRSIPRNLMNVALIGYRGTGKTTIAELLARRLGWDWVDADVEIERRAGKSIAAMFDDGGEPAFRDAEAAVVLDVTSRARSVIAFGGGAVLRDASRAAIAERCYAIWLTASVETILRRVAGDATTLLRRPNLTIKGGREEIVALLAAREPIYRELADLEINTEERDPEGIVGEIATRLPFEVTRG